MTAAVPSGEIQGYARAAAAPDVAAAMGKCRLLDAHQNLGEVLQVVGRYLEAVVHCERAVALIYRSSVGRWRPYAHLLQPLLAALDIARLDERSS